MKQKLTIVGKAGRFFLCEEDHEYTTPCLFNISSRDLGLIKAIRSKIDENKPNLVKRYLKDLDNAELVNILKDLFSIDGYWPQYNITNNSNLCAVLLKGIQLRKLIDAYSECGSINLALSVAANDIYEDFDDFMAGMAATSGITMSAARDTAELHYANLCGYFEDQHNRDVSEELSIDFLEQFILKHNASILPKGPRARRNFWNTMELLDSKPANDIENLNDEELDKKMQEEESERVSKRIAELDDEISRMFEIVREFVSKHDDFGLDGNQRYKAVYRPSWHPEPVCFWFNPPFNEKGESRPRVSNTLILTKTGRVLVEENRDGEMYDILDCLGDTLLNAAYAITGE